MLLPLFLSEEQKGSCPLLQHGSAVASVGPVLSHGFCGSALLPVVIPEVEKRAGRVTASLLVYLMFFARLCRAI